ncbi:hypothetical protein LZ30DRAFT_734835 [Colletotrichum cereale]|nr:hypothetical protein LZ30DRAFT_734835 [Colletotrichum cereale]
MIQISLDWISTQKSVFFFVDQTRSSLAPTWDMQYCPSETPIIYGYRRKGTYSVLSTESEALRTRSRFTLSSPSHNHAHVHIGSSVRILRRAAHIRTTLRHSAPFPPHPASITAITPVRLHGRGNTYRHRSLASFTTMVSGDKRRPKC